MAAEALETLADKAKPVFEGTPEVRLALAFGSRARGQARADSDLDVAVWAPGVDRLGLQARLAAALGIEADVVALEDPDLPLLAQVIEDGVLFYERAPGMHASWRFKALSILDLDGPPLANTRDAWLRRVAKRGLLNGAC